MFQGSLEARDTLCGEMVSVYPSACADLKIVQMADEARARGNIMVYVRTTAITHTLVAPGIHSTRKSESPLIKKYGCQVTNFGKEKKMTCEIGRFLKALESYGLLQEKLDEYSKEMGDFFKDKLESRKRTDLIKFFEEFEETKDLFDEGSGVSYEECCYRPEGGVSKCKVLPFRHRLCTYIEYLPQGILDAELEGNSAIPKPQFIEEVRHTSLFFENRSIPSTHTHTTNRFSAYRIAIFLRIRSRMMRISEVAPDFSSLLPPSRARRR